MRDLGKNMKAENTETGTRIVQEGSSGPVLKQVLRKDYDFMECVGYMDAVF